MRLIFKGEATLLAIYLASMRLEFLIRELSRAAFLVIGTFKDELGKQVPHYLMRAGDSGCLLALRTGSVLPRVPPADASHTE